MNIYRHSFSVLCPNNGVSINYTLEVTSNRTIMAEDIVKACARDKAFHENLADDLLIALGGSQVLRAHHHGVDIETRRG